MGMREDFERWMLANYAADIPPREGDGYADTFMQFAWLSWQHLYPEVERLRGLVKSGYVEGWCDGFEECADQHEIYLKSLPLAEWDASTTKAKLEADND